jgi:hypothetical protein
MHENMILLGYPGDHIIYFNCFPLQRGCQKRVWMKGYMNKRENSSACTLILGMNYASLVYSCTATHNNVVGIILSIQ